MEQQFANDFHLRASVDSSSISDGGSPAAPPMHMLSLSSPIPWSRENGSNSTVDNAGGRSPADGERPTLTIPPQPTHPTGFQLSGPMSPYETSANGSYPSSPGIAPKSAINPIFKVVSSSVVWYVYADWLIGCVSYSRRYLHFKRDQVLCLPFHSSRPSRRASIPHYHPCPSHRRRTSVTTSADPCSPLPILSSLPRPSSVICLCCCTSSLATCRISRSFLLRI